MYIRDTFLCALAALVGEECWGVVGGAGAGTIISLKIGARTLRARPVPNELLSDLVRRYDAAYKLRLHCPWRIDAGYEVVSGSHMSNENDGPMVRGFEAIIRQKITAVACTGAGLDLRIDFENGCSLVAHCSSIGVHEGDCYVFGTPKGWFTVEPDGRLTLEPECE